jgi:hypothetical protein
LSSSISELDESCIVSANGTGIVGTPLGAVDDEGSNDVVGLNDKEGWELGDSDADGEFDGSNEAVGSSEIVGITLGCCEIVGITLGSCEIVGTNVGFFEGEPVITVGASVSTGIAVGVLVSIEVGVLIGARDVVGEAETVGEADTVGFALSVGAAVAVGPELVESCCVGTCVSNKAVGAGDKVAPTDGSSVSRGETVSSPGVGEEVGERVRGRMVGFCVDRGRMVGFCVGLDGFRVDSLVGTNVSTHGRSTVEKEGGL